VRCERATGTGRAGESCTQARVVSAVASRVRLAQRGRANRNFHGACDRCFHVIVHRILRMKTHIRSIKLVRAFVFPISVCANATHTQSQTMSSAGSAGGVRRAKGTNPSPRSSIVSPLVAHEPSTRERRAVNRREDVNEHAMPMRCCAMPVVPPRFGSTTSGCVRGQQSADATLACAHRAAA
jgi:hypothetical protein